MKHTIKVTAALAVFFFAAQLIGLLVINQYIDHKKTFETKAVAYKPLPYGFERPEVKNQSTSFIWIAASILTGTLLLLLLVKYKKPLIWKFMFFIAVCSTLTFAFAAFISPAAAGVLALALSVWRIYKPNVIVQNLSEVFIYGGLAASVINIFNLFSVSMLLVVISAYDYISVFKTRHMITLAEFQSKSRLFAGLYLPYEKGKILPNEKLPKYDAKKHSEYGKKSLSKKSVAILGGGDIGFTLLFAGVVMKGMTLQETALSGFMKALIVPVFATIALLVLLIKGRHGKFYPAMPVLSLGCFLGYLVVLLV